MSDDWQMSESERAVRIIQALLAMVAGTGFTAILLWGLTVEAFGADAKANDLPYHITALKVLPECKAIQMTQAAEVDDDPSDGVNLPLNPISVGDDGVWAWVRISPEDMRAIGYLTPLCMEVFLNGELHESWQAVDCFGFDSKGSELTDWQPFTRPSRGVGTRAIGAFWPQVNPDSDYRMMVKLHRYADGVSQQQLCEMLKTNPAAVMTVLAYAPKDSK